MSKQKEETLCAWCGELCDDSTYNYNGEFICLDCYESAVDERIKNHKFWEGVKNAVVQGLR